MDDRSASLLPELVACRAIVDQYVDKLDDACVEYYERGTTLFPRLSRAEDEDNDLRCSLILTRIAEFIPDAVERWEKIDYPIHDYDTHVERARDYWVRRRNLLRTLESTLRAALELSDVYSQSQEGSGLITILFLAADPTDATRLRLSEEFREIDQSLRMAQQRDHFRLALPQLAVRPSDISRAVLEEKPAIVHFSGHGTAEGQLCFEDATGKVNAVEPEALTALFQLVSNHVKCVVMNACYSATQSEGIAQHIDYVVGMDKAISDKAAITFAVGFYQALGAGKNVDVDRAYKFGCVQIRLQGVSEHLTPVLRKRQR